MGALGPRVRRSTLPPMQAKSRERQRKRRMSTLLDDCQRHWQVPYSVDYLRALFAQLIVYTLDDRMPESIAFEYVTRVTDSHCHPRRARRLQDGEHAAQPLGGCASDWQQPGDH
jgi:hypothetical protein